MWIHVVVIFTGCNSCHTYRQALSEPQFKYYHIRLKNEYESVLLSQQCEYVANENPILEELMHCISWFVVSALPFFLHLTGTHNGKYKCSNGLRINTQTVADCRSSCHVHAKKVCAPDNGGKLLSLIIARVAVSKSHCPDVHAIRQPHCDDRSDEVCRLLISLGRHLELVDHLPLERLTWSAKEEAYQLWNIEVSVVVVCYLESTSPRARSSGCAAYRNTTQSGAQVE